MTIQSEIEALELQLAALRAQQARCQHDWGPVAYTPYSGTESYHTGRYETHGVHFDPVMARREVMKPRWTRTCRKCGLPQHTERQREVAQPKQYEADFR